MGTHPIFESDFDCLTDMRILSFGRLLSAKIGSVRTKYVLAQVVDDKLVEAVLPHQHLPINILVETLDGYEAWITGDLLPIVEESVTGVVDLTAILEEEHQMGLTKWGYLTRIEQPDEQDCFIAKHILTEERKNSES